MRLFSIALVTGLIVSVGTAFAGSVDEVRPAKSKGIVDIENVAGVIDVIGWDRPQVHVKGTLGPRVQRLDFENRDGHTLIRVVLPRVRMGGNGMWARLTIHVPWDSRLDIHAVSADVTVSGVYGAMELEAVSGNIEVSSAMAGPPEEPETDSQERNEPDKEPLIPLVPSEVDAHTVSGGVRIAIDAGEIRAETVSGRISVEGNADEVRAETVSGRISVEGNARGIEAETVSGRVTVEGVSGKIEIETVSGEVEATGWWKDYRSESISGDVELRMRPTHASVPVRNGTTRVDTHSGEIQFEGCVMPDGRLDMSAHSGDIDVIFQGDVNADLSVKTHSGDITTRGKLFEGQNTTIHNVGRALMCTIGAGDAEIHVQTHSGDIVLDQR